MTNRLRWLLAVAALAAPTPALAQFDPTSSAKPPLPGDGSEMFRFWLHLAGIQPATRVDLLRVNERDYSGFIVIVFGDPMETGADGSALACAADVARQGGAVMIVTDTPVHFAQVRIFNRLGVDQEVMIDGTQVFGPSGALYRGFAACPFVEPVSPNDLPAPPRQPNPVWDVFRDLDQIATNYPSFLVAPQRRVESLYPLAKFPAGSRTARATVRPDGRLSSLLPDNALFAMGGDIPHPDTRQRFRFLAMADHSVFINQMLVDPGIDNNELALRVITYLKDPEGKNRQRCIFFERGAPVTDFRTAAYVLEEPLPSLPLPALGQMQEKLVEMGNQIIDRMQQNDAFNQMLLGRTEEQRERQLRRIIGFLLLVATVFAAIRVLTRIWHVRQPTDTPTPPVTGQPGTPDPTTPAGIFDRRQRELLRRDNLFEPVRTVIREMFITAGAPPDAGPKLPGVAITEAVLQPDTLKKALADLWRIGFGPPRRLSVRQWSVLEPLFIRVRRAYDDGKWRFVAYG